jgi:hypothetical protein
MKAPTREEARFLIAELPRCHGAEGFGCAAAQPGIVFVNGMGRHVCNACAEQIEARDRVDSPIASLARAWLAELSRADDGAVVVPPLAVAG